MDAIETSNTPPTLFAIDDDRDILNLIREFTQIAGLNFSYASSWSYAAEEGLRAADVILLDLHIGEHNGADIMKYMAENAITTPLIISSGIDQNVIESAERLALDYQLNLSGVLAKPFRLDNFQMLVKEALYNEREAEIRQPENQSDDLATTLELDLVPDWFDVNFQPLINAVTNRIEEVECLARMNHPSLGSIAPLDFIPRIEASGKISDFTLLIIDKGLNALRPILEHNLELKVAFNLSAKSLTDKFYKQLLKTLDGKSIDCYRITFEITESNILSFSIEARLTLTKLRIRGFALSLDDFGTGFSTVTQLDSMPFNAIKIDKSFVAGIGQRDTSEAIVVSTIQMGNKLNYRVVAEGVETQEQFEFLVNAGCPVIQGYLIAKPMGEKQLAKFFEETQGVVVTRNRAEQLINQMRDCCHNIIVLQSQSINSVIDYFKELKDIFSVTALSELTTEEVVGADLILTTSHTALSENPTLKPALEQKKVVVYQDRVDPDAVIQLHLRGVREIISSQQPRFDFLQQLFHLCHAHREKTQLEEESRTSQKAALSAMQEAASYGEVLQFCKSVFLVTDAESLARETLRFLSQSGIPAAIALRSDHGDCCYSLTTDSVEPASDLVVQVMELLKDKGRIYQYNNRIIVNGPTLSLLFFSVPETDEALGQFRDYIASIAHIIEEKWLEVCQRRDLMEISQRVSDASESLGETIRFAALRSQQAFDDFHADILASFHILDLTEEQEDFLINLVKQMMERSSLSDDMKGIYELILNIRMACQRALEAQTSSRPEAPVEDELDDVLF